MSITFRQHSRDVVHPAAYRGRSKALSAEKANELRKRVAGGEQKAGLARENGISRETLYQYLNTTS